LTRFLITTISCNSEQQPRRERQAKSAKKNTLRYEASLLISGLIGDDCKPLAPNWPNWLKITAQKIGLVV
jgi:hypothetical protein